MNVQSEFYVFRLVFFGWMEERVWYLQICRCWQNHYISWGLLWRESAHALGQCKRVKECDLMNDFLEVFHAWGFQVHLIWNLPWVRWWINELHFIYRHPAQIGTYAFSLVAFPSREKCIWQSICNARRNLLSIFEAFFCFQI